MSYKMIPKTMLALLAMHPNAVASQAQDAIELIKRGEGFRLGTYYDTMGYPTTGYGHRLRNGEAPAKTRAQATRYLFQDFKHAYDAAYKVANGFEPEQTVLTVMAFQLGETGMRQFKSTITALKAGECYEALMHMRASLWYRQTPRRIELIEQWLDQKGYLP